MAGKLSSDWTPESVAWAIIGAVFGVCCVLYWFGILHG